MEHVNKILPYLILLIVITTLALLKIGGNGATWVLWVMFGATLLGLLIELMGE